MKLYIQTIFVASFCAVLLISFSLAFGNDSPLSKKVRTDNDSNNSIYFRLELFNSTNNIVELLQIVKDIECLPVEQMNDSAKWMEQRLVKLELWLKAVDVIDRLIDPNFDLRNVPQKNVAPPIGFDSGVSPSEIEDATLREQYEQAIEANTKKAEQYRFQKKLYEMDKVVSTSVAAYIKGAYTNKEQDTKEINDSVDSIISSTSRKEEIKKDFNKNTR